ncbi:ROK family transcriptional regulator [Micromonospora coxensis]|uniref:Sugar kinase of the NBD/HSP70 family, may contain an N-terminal HTH domain n=1 Tax=Micromonospora coxensis TaxID=356852 RepID=A0A1C5GVR7_9ACTN|nr:ROK family transcriptional regulator [Micromonospora coxensis]SCG37896.1 Sugar kinase of the NBD/HSP70 family, may contain an N-terminal HTH domain [Micromonospora coxensis]
MSTTSGAHTLVRRSHEERVLRILQRFGALSRGEIARRVGLSRTTVSEITTDLLGRGAITVVDTDANERAGSGRPAERLAIDPGSGQYMGVDFGHRRVNVAVADAAHEIIATGTARYPESAQWPERLSAAFALVERLQVDRRVHYGALQAVGVGVPGWGDRSWADGVAESFADRFHASVIVDNNVRFAGLAEALHSHPDTVNNLIYLRLSDGVGGSLVVDGRLVRGATSFAGELGHVTVAEAGTAACRCGKRGCVETFASAPAILARCRAEGAQVQTIDELRTAVAIAHPGVERVLRDTGAVIGRVLGAAAMTLNPSEVVVSGEIVDVSPALVQQVAATITYELSWQPEMAPVVRAAVLRDEGGALGAVAALFHESPLLKSYPEAVRAPSGGRTSTTKEHNMAGPVVRVGGARCRS